MRARKGLWIGGGALCALAVVIGYLARPEDELAGMMRLHPRVTVVKLPDAGARNAMITQYDFVAATPDVLASLQKERSASASASPSRIPPGGSSEYDLPDGRQVSVLDYSTLATTDGTKCIVIVEDYAWPWYQRAWATIRHRLGL